DGTAMHAHLDLNGTAGESLRVPLTRGATSLNALLPNGGFNASAAASPVTVAPLQTVASRQDLYLDPEGHKVSVLFNRPVALQNGSDWRTKFTATIAFNRDGIVSNGNRPIFAAALQEDERIVNLSFDNVLTTNAGYSIALGPLVDPLTQREVSFQTLQPKIDNTRPAGILYGKFLKGDNTPIGAAEVRLYTGHFRGCKVGLMDDEPPIDCNPYLEAPQYARSEADGSFLFEYVPRDLVSDPGLTGGYRLIGVSSGGKFTLLDGAVRLPGRVHFVNLQLLGRGAAEGVAKYDNGDKVVGGEIYVGSTMFNVGRSTTTDNNGFFHVDDLPVGPITFSVKDAAGNIAFASGEIATPGQLVTKELTIYRKPFPGTGTVFGVVRRSDTNAPVVAARVGVSSQGFGLSETLTDSDGRFEFRRVPAGFVTVLAAEWSVSRQSTAVDFDLRTDETREVNLVLGVAATNDATANLSGDVIRENPLFPGDPSKYERVAGAIVKLGGRPVTADSNGHFTFDSLPLAFGGHLEIHAYDPSTKRVGTVQLPTLTEAGPNNITIFIAANSFGTGTIRVRLISATGQPVSGFRVIEPGYPPTVFSSLGGGVYELSAGVGGNVEIWAVNGPGQYGDQFAHDSAHLEFPGQVASVTMRLPGQGTVRVKLHGDFDIINDVNLSYPAWDENEQALQPKTLTMSTNVNGIADFATFTKVPALLDYSVESIHPSYGYSGAAGKLGYDGDLATHILQLKKLATIRGTVYAIDGRTPIAGAAIRLNDGSRDTGISYSQPDGTFTYRDVPPSTFFSISAETTQSGIYRTGIAYGTTPSAGGPIDGLAVIMRRRGSVEGKVVYLGYKRFDPNNPANNVVDDTPNDLSDNAPVSLAKLWLRELDFPRRSFGSDADPLTADVAGRFALSSVFVGALHAKAWDSGNQELQGDWTGTLDEEGQPLTAYIGIGSGGTGNIHVTIADPNQSNAPVVNAEVGLYKGFGLFDLTSSDSNGVATFQQVPVASYSISAYSKALGKSGTSPTFNVQRDLVSQLRILLEFSGRVDGTFTDPESVPAGRAIPGATVTLSGSSYQSRSSTSTIGAFTFDGVREGFFTLDAKDTDSNRRAKASHTLSAADPHPIVNLELERTETLNLSVYLPDDTGAVSGVLGGPVSIDVVQRGGDFVRSAQGNPIVMPKLLAAEMYEIAVQEIGGLQRQLWFSGRFPKGTAADPVKLVYPAYGAVEVTVTQGGAPASGAKVTISGVGTSATLFTDATGKVVAGGIRLGNISAQAVSFDGGFSGSASGTLDRQSVTARLAIDLGAYAGVSGLVESEAGGPSVGTRVLATFAGRALEMSTGSDGRYTFQGIPTTTSGTVVSLTYIGTDGVTIGARQSITLFNDSASRIIALPTVKLDATPPQIVSITPADGAQNVSPDSTIRVVFSERIRADQVSNSYLQLIPADGTAQVVATFDPPVTASDGTFIITMRPPPAPSGQRFPLKSNTLYRVIVSGAIEDLTGHRLPGPLGITFTTSDYTEPHVIKVVPSPSTPVQQQVTFQFTFNEPVDPAPWQPGSASFHFYKISAAGPAGQIVAEKAGRAYLDPATNLTLNFAPNDPIESESFYRIVFSGIRDLQGNALAEQTFHFFSFDQTK
ncbi:MAG TPA: Ig-like domain-containing protein, partial [Thermoanaerobaculia bacterium]|nr:Ig-like domain-containing protein [Thermoanaerobaculia bacterium]